MPRPIKVMLLASDVLIWGALIWAGSALILGIPIEQSKHPNPTDLLVLVMSVFVLIGHIWWIADTWIESVER